MNIPETWNSITEFADWYQQNGYPRKVPMPPEVFVTDVGTSIILFRQGLFQVEFYVASPNFTTSKHYHPFEQIIILVGGGGQGRIGSSLEEEPQWMPFDRVGQRLAPLSQIMWHQLKVLEHGICFYNCQKWESEEEMTSAIIEYEGDSLGPMHEEMLKTQRKNRG